MPDKFDELMRDAASSYHNPPEPPLNEMWRAIEGERVVARRAGPSWVLRVLPLAAVFVTGLVLGRVTSHRNSVVVAPASVAVAPSQSSTPVVLASNDGVTDRYLGQTTALLIALPSELQAPRTDAGFNARANDLLVTTRVLLDSPSASNDPSMHGLLDDLELVLAQVVRLQHERNATEVDLINQAVEQRQLLTRLQSAVADRTAN